MSFGGVDFKHIIDQRQVPWPMEKPREPRQQHTHTQTEADRYEYNISLIVRTCKGTTQI